MGGKAQNYQNRCQLSLVRQRLFTKLRLAILFRTPFGATWNASDQRLKVCISKYSSNSVSLNLIGQCHCKMYRLLQVWNPKRVINEVSDSRWLDVAWQISQLLWMAQNNLWIWSIFAFTSVDSYDKIVNILNKISPNFGIKGTLCMCQILNQQWWYQFCSLVNQSKIHDKWYKIIYEYKVRLPLPGQTAIAK